MAAGPGRAPGGIRIQEPADRHRESNAAAAAAALPPPAPPSAGCQERPHGPSGAAGGSGSPSAADAAARKGKGVLAPSPPSSSTSSEDTGSPGSHEIISDKEESSSADTLADGGRKMKVVTWKKQLVEETVEVPKVTRPLDVKSEFDNLTPEQQWALAEDMELRQLRQRQQAQQRKSLSSKFKGGMANLFLERIGRQMHNSNPDSTAITPHVNHQTIPMTRIIEHYKLTEMVAGRGVSFHPNALNLHRAYSEFRPVHGDGQSFYRSFIFSYLEQVLDRQDTQEEHRLLASVKGVARHQARLGWTSEFSSGYKAFKTLLKSVMRWKRHSRWKNVPTTDSYRKQKLLKFFSGYGRSINIFAFLRLVAAIWICSHSEEFEPLIPELNEYGTLREWCFHQVIRYKVFTDQVQMTALVTALGVPLRVEYLFQDAGQDLYIGQESQDSMPRSTCWPCDHQVPPDHEVPRVTVLYTQAHYDIIYPYHPDAPVTSDESSGQSPSQYQIGSCSGETSSQQIDQLLDKIGNSNGNYTRPHVNYQKVDITEIIRHYNFLEMVAGQGAELRSHIPSLRVTYSEFRPVIGDGECFYRSFIFSYLEQVLDRQDLHEEHRLLAAVKEVARQHARLGWASDFSRSQKVFKKLIKKVMRWKARRRWKHVPTSNSYCITKLLEFFCDYKRTDDIFTFLRLVAAIWICSHSEEFVPLIHELNEGYTLTEWCFQKVIQRKVFTDHIQITALVRALRVPLRVEYLFQEAGQDLYIGQDRQDDPRSTCWPRHRHQVPSDHEVPRVTLLYVFQHYDILYPHRDDEGPESSSQQIPEEDTCSGDNLNGHPFLVHSWFESAGSSPSSKIRAVPVGLKRIPITKVSNELKLWQSYIFFRPVRKDGECFYRCFIFSYLEQVIDRQDTYEEHRLLADVKIVCRQHAMLGLSSEFSRTNRAFKKLIKKIMRWKRSRPLSYRKQKLLEFFNIYERSSYILAFLRLVAAVHICSYSEEFKPLLPELTKGSSLRDWCLTSIIKTKVFTNDDIQIKALARALGVPLRLEYVSGETKDLYALQPSKDDMARSTCCQKYPRMPSDYEVPRVTLLCTEEQYYILYPGLSLLAYEKLNVALPCVN